MAKKHRRVAAGAFGAASHVAVAALLLLVGGAAAAPANDSFAGAQALSGTTGTITGSNVSAPRETSEPCPTRTRRARRSGSRGPRPSPARELRHARQRLRHLRRRLHRDAHRPPDFGRGNDIDFDVGSARAQFKPSRGRSTGAGRRHARRAGSVTSTWNRPRPPNDNFANAQALRDQRDGQRQHLLATAEPGEPRDYGQGDSIWYRWTAPTTGQFEFDGSGEYDPYVVFYTGSALTSLTWQAVKRCDRAPAPAHGYCGRTYRLKLDSAELSADGATLLAGTRSRRRRTTRSPRHTARLATGRRSRERLGCDRGARRARACGHAARYSVWYRWRAPATLTVDLAVDDNDFHCDTAVYMGAALRR